MSNGTTPIGHSYVFPFSLSALGAQLDVVSVTMGSGVKKHVGILETVDLVTDEF